MPHMQRAAHKSIRIAAFNECSSYGLKSNGVNKMNELIRKRKSIRKYDSTPLDDSTLDKIQARIEMLAPLYPDIRYTVEIDPSGQEEA